MGQIIEYTLLYKKGMKKTENKSMETTYLIEIFLTGSIKTMLKFDTFLLTDLNTQF